MTQAEDKPIEVVKNFNSHAHVERDLTFDDLSLTIEDFNSHAHVERDVLAVLDRYARVYFNSHAHVERDPTPGTQSGISSISTHTLTWSVTLDVVYIWCLLNVMRTYFFI